jgi:hypothetical protein
MILLVELESGGLGVEEWLCGVEVFWRISRNFLLEA